MDKGEALVKKPTYPGGRMAMDAFVKSNIQYPEKALAHKISGTVAVTIDIDENGFVKKGKVKKGIGFGCDEEAVRICKLLKFSTASKRKNRRMTFHRTINIHFRLPKVNPITENKKEIAPKQAVPIQSDSPGLQIVYSFVPKKKP